MKLLSASDEQCLNAFGRPELGDRRERKISDNAGNFDRISSYYHYLEVGLGGKLMQRCRLAFLPLTQHCRRALLVGEGTGQFLIELLRFNSQIQVVCVEHSARMIQQMRKRLAMAKLDATRIEFWQADALHWTPPIEKFDLVATNFFLSCLRHEEIQRLVPLLADGTTDDATWLQADFCEPKQGWRRWRAKSIIRLLYIFFRLTASLAARQLTPPDQFLTQAGFVLRQRRQVSFGLAHSDFWQRNP